MNNLYRERKFLKKKDRVLDIKNFYTSLMLKLIFIIVLAGINYYLNQWSNPWFIWVALGLGFSLIFKIIKAFGWVPFLNKSWEHKKIKEFIENDNNQ